MSNNYETIFRRAVATAACAAVLVAATSARAVTLHNFTLVNDQSEDRLINVSENGVSYFSVFAGRYKATLDGGPALHVWCVDLTHNINFGETYLAYKDQRITNPAGPLAGNYYQGGLSSALVNGDFTTVSALEAARRSSMSAYLTDSFLNATSFSGVSGSTNLVDNLAAIQLAQWDLIQDGGDGLSAGNMRVDAAGQAAYGGLVSYYESLALAHTSYTTNSAYWIQGPVAGIGQHRQNFTAKSTPEPGALAMFGGCMVAGLGVLIRRKRRA